MHLSDTIIDLESHITECDRIIEKLVYIRSQIYKEVENYLFVIERQKSRYQSNLGVLEKARGIIDNKDISSKKGWREEVLLRDHFTCQRCKSIDNLTIHHIIPKAICSDEQLWDTSNGITLCKDCHNQWHNEHSNGSGIYAFIKWLSNTSS